MPYITALVSHDLHFGISFGFASRLGGGVNFIFHRLREDPASPFFSHHFSLGDGAHPQTPNNYFHVIGFMFDFRNDELEYLPSIDFRGIARIVISWTNVAYQHAPRFFEGSGFPVSPEKKRVAGLTRRREKSHVIGFMFDFRNDELAGSAYWIMSSYRHMSIFEFTRR